MSTESSLVFHSATGICSRDSCHSTLSQQWSSDLLRCISNCCAPRYLLLSKIMSQAWLVFVGLEDEGGYHELLYKCKGGGLILKISYPCCSRYGSGERFRPQDAVACDPACPWCESKDASPYRVRFASQISTIWGRVRQWSRSSYNGPVCAEIGLPETRS